MSTLLPFHKTILENIHDPATNDLLILARGLGMRRIICTLMKIYDSPRNLVLLVNATPEEEAEIGEELGIMGCRKPGLRVIGYETNSKDRQEIYKKGGLISVTSRILVVDMLQSDIPVPLITGLIVLHAEKISPLVLEAFLVRLYREKNKKGFLKAFTDQPEHITSGLSPLKNIMKELQLRNVHLYPRFQEDIKQTLERRRADVIELSQPLTELMSDIHHAIIQCMSTTLSELKRSNTTLDLDDFKVENAYFKQFDMIVRRQLDSVWHKVGPKTKQLVNDLGTLRRLLYYLLTYDPLQFHAYLETLIAANTTTASGAAKQHQSPWLLTDAAHIIFQSAKRRCYTMTSAASSTTNSAQKPPAVITIDDDDDAWAALDEIEGVVPTKDKGKDKEARPWWLPAGMDPVLEELPKWNLLSEIIQETEEEMIRQETARKSITNAPQASNVVLVMTSSTRTCNVLTKFLATMDHDAHSGSKGRAMMMEKLRLYLWWKSKLAEQKQDGTPKPLPDGLRGKEPSSNSGISEALKKKDREKAERAGSRRRVRGGAPAPAAPARPADGQDKSGRNETVMGEIQQEAASFVEFWDSQAEMPIDLTEEIIFLDIHNGGLLSEFDTHFGLLPPEQTVLIRAYSDDTDDRMLEEIRPKFVVMFEPNMEFIRRIEVYKSANPGMAVRVYHMVYGNSCEEHKYLAGIRKEKESFERLIKERGTMLLPIFEDRTAGNDDIIKTISTRIAGGRREINAQPSQVIVDMREFRSSLPSLLHAANILVIPATLTVGDYIITPDICVERKSLTDLISSFNSGRLYTQCELMSVHYKTPVLLIEFEEDKAFTLDIVSDLKSYVKPTGKYPKKKQGPGENALDAAALLQSKITLLILTFPRVRIIWSSSPYATAEIFKDLKNNQPEPDPSKAIAVGAEDDPQAGAGINSQAEELLRCLPGINAKNVKHVMSKIGSVRELCEMSMVQVQEILGAEPGKQCWEFMHKGEKPSKN